MIMTLESARAVTDAGIAKAFGAVAFRRSSAEVQKLAEAKPTFFSGVSAMTQGRLLFSMGALPILKEERCLGAVGVSGAKAEQD